MSSSWHLIWDIMSSWRLIWDIMSSGRLMWDSAGCTKVSWVSVCRLNPEWSMMSPITVCLMTTSVSIGMNTVTPITAVGML